METMTGQAWYTVYIVRHGLSEWLTIKAWDARDARCTAEDMYPGWRVIEVTRTED